MEEFKKPSFPNVALKIEQDDMCIKTSDNAINCKESFDLRSKNPYRIPQWSGNPCNDNNYSFEVLKSGQIIDEIKDLQKKAFWSFGRLPENDIEMAHPTISRFHAILQYRPKWNRSKTCNAQDKNKEGNLVDVVDEGAPPQGWYIYDLESTHGTFLNKQRIPAKVYIRIKVGHLLRLGASTRSYIFQGPVEDEEPESNLSITEIKARRQQGIEEITLEKKLLAQENNESVNNEGCSWGMGEDADEESDLAHNPYATSNNEELFLDDPKKTLRGYFEREGLELIYKCDEMSAGSFVCRVELPIYDTNGRNVIAEVVHKGKKKDCVLHCALEACRILDRHGVLRQANQEPLKRKQKLHESDSDDDEFWDRTGDIARKKQRKSTPSTSETLTYEDLLNQEKDIEENMKKIACKINDYQEQQKRIKEQETNEGEDLDVFMEKLHEKETKFDKTDIRKLRIEEQRLKAEKQKLQRLIQIAKPVDMQFNIKPREVILPEQNESTVRKQLPMVGKRNQYKTFKVLKFHNTKNIKAPTLLNSDEEVEEEDMDSDMHEEKTVNNEILLDKNLLKQSTVEKDEKIRSQENTDAKDEACDEICKDRTESLQLSMNNETADSGSSIKKKRQRNRQREKRDEVHMSDSAAYEPSEKYATWLPPENQTGDGFTDLNKKYGY